MFSAGQTRRRHRLHWLLLGLLLVGLLSGGVARPAVLAQAEPAGMALAKEVDVVGTVDCGRRSGRACEIQDRLAVWTDSLSGERSRVTLDVSWVRSSLPALDQDDEIVAVVDVRPDGTLQVLSLDADAHHDGTVNPGASTGSREVTESRHDRAADQDRDQSENAPGGGVPTGALTGTVRDASAGVALAGVTVRVAGQSALTDASGRFSIGGLAAGDVTLEASASGYVTQQQGVTIVAGQTVDVVVQLATVPAPGRGSVVGTVVDATTGAPISGATVAGAGRSVTTDSTGGFALTDLAPGTLTLTVSATGYSTRQQTVAVTSGSATAITVSLPQATGTVTGTVRNGATSAPIPGATVRVGSLTATTDANGRFSLAGLRTGSATLEVSASGFVTQQQAVTVTEGSTEVVVALPEVGPNIAVTVTWAAQPFDLDAHLSGPGAGGTRFHVSFVNKNPVPYAGLTMDTAAGFGPEQIVVRPDPSGGQFVPGEYRFWVDNFSESPEYDVSQARAVITQGGQQLGVFTAAAATGDPSLDLWYVANLTIDAAGTVTVTPVQRFVSGNETTVLAVPAHGGKK
jgi:hypothetical protein